jgi:hypothetical protein
MGGEEQGTTDVVLMVCIECGTEHTFEAGGGPPDDLVCEKCGGEVFRRFEDTASPGEARQDFEETTARDLDTDDPEGDATPGDLHDLNNP